MKHNFEPAENHIITHLGMTWIYNNLEDRNYQTFSDTFRLPDDFESFDDDIYLFKHDMHPDL